MHLKWKILWIPLLLLCVMSGTEAFCGSLSSDIEKDRGPLGEICIFEKGNVTESRTMDTDEVLINPGKGYVFLGYLDTEEYREDFKDMISVGYNRFGWNKIEPEEGVYDWSNIDSYIDYYRKRGRQFAFGVMCANTYGSSEYITPQWVFEAGARGKEIVTESEVTQMIPDWTDPVFLEKLNGFIQALADRYDGNPDIAYIDIRSYGNWGEQHTFGIEDAWPDITSEQLKELYLKPYMESFRATQLVIPWGKEIYNDTYQWAVEQGVTIRRDGIVTYSDGSEGRMVYGKAPAIFEYPGSYMKEAREKGDWKYDEVEAVIENGAPTYLQLYQDMYDSNRTFYDELANRIGYYFRFKGAVYQNKIVDGKPCDIRLTFRNDGVAPIYEPAVLKIGLLDSDYNPVHIYPLSDSPGEWMPGEEVTVNASLELEKSGGGLRYDEYILAVGMFADDEDDKPDYRLGSTGATDDDWYVFGMIGIRQGLLA